MDLWIQVFAQLGAAMAQVLAALDHEPEREFPGCW